jgi:hypothetical protein
MSPTLEFLFEIHCALSTPLELGAGPGGFRRVIEISSGDFEGPRIRGTVLPGGADWQIVRSDGVTELQAHYILRTDDGVHIRVRNAGLRRADEVVFNRIVAGESVDPSEYYFRTTPVFEAPEGPYVWLNQSVFLATGARFSSAVTLWFFRVA